MKQDKASFTAEATAIWRAAESLNPNDVRVCYDPFAKYFLNGIYRFIINWSILRKIGIWYADRVAPGAYGEVVARTRYIDNYLETCIKNSIEQLVILGAGYDSRAYRFDELKEKVKVFEVDHPYTQIRKKEKVKKIIGFLPDYVVHIPVDFDREKLDQRLFESGYDRNLMSLFIWEGVTTYITAEAADETLAFVANNSGKGSSIIFNYLFKSVVDGTCELEGANKWRKALIQRGEPPTFGIQENNIEEFLEKRGFDQIKDIKMDSLRKAYFKGKNKKRKVSPWVGIVNATVKLKK